MAAGKWGLAALQWQDSWGEPGVAGLLVLGVVQPSWCPPCLPWAPGLEVALS